MAFKAKTAVAAIILITAAGGLSYRSAIHDGSTNFDDHWMVAENPLVQQASAENIHRIIVRPYHGVYQPVTFLSYMADYAVWEASGIDAIKGVHATNVLLHIANALLVALLCAVVLQDLAGDGLGREGVAFASVFAGLLFVLHPLHVESVAWLSSRKDVLSFGFMLLSLLSVRAAFCSASRAWWVWGGAAVVLFSFAVGSKVTAVSLVPLGVMYWFLLGRPRALRAGVVFGILCVIGAAGTLVAARAAAAGGYLARPVGGSYLVHYMTVLRTFPFYMRKLLFPVNLSAVYVLAPAGGSGDASVWLGAALLSGQIAVASFVRVRLARFIVLWYLIALLPVMQLVPVPVPALAADRYAYTASLSFALAPALLAWKVRRVLIGRGALAASTALVAACVLYAGTLGAATWSRTRVWRSSRTLWEDTLAKHPSSRMALVNLGAVYLEDGDIEAARTLYENVLRIDPHYVLAHYQLGRIFEKTDAPYLARAVYTRLLASESSLTERYTRRYKGLAALRLAAMSLEDGRFGSAQSNARMALELVLTPARAAEMIRLSERGGDALAADMDDSDLMKEALLVIHRADESLREARRIADMLVAAGDDAVAEADVQLAERHYRRAAEAAEEYAVPRLRLARLYSRYGQWDAAWEEFAAARIRGAAGAAFEHDYGLAAIGTGRYHEATERFERALELAPEMSDALVKLAFARAHTGEVAKALDIIEEVLAAEPANEDARLVKEIILEIASGSSHDQ